jgi:transposase
MALYVGIDWASEAHAVCVLDRHGRVRWTGTVAHSATGLAELIRRLTRFASPAQIRIALERSSGLLVDTLLEAGFGVVPIHPNAVKAMRPRYSAAGAKSDPGDAYLLADVLRTDGHRFRALTAPTDATRALRTLVRGREDLVAARVALGNQLRALLERVWPGAATIFAEVTSPIALAFLARYPTAESAAGLGERRLAQFLGAHAYSGRRAPAQLLARLRAAPISRVAAAEAAASADVIRALVAALEPLVRQLHQLNAAITAAVAHHRDGAVVTSFPRSGQINAAQILAELGDDRRRFTSADHLAAEAGVAPITRESGKSRGVGFRWACNKRLRQAITTFADNSRHASAWAAAVYTRARLRGCDHPHAIRVLGRAWVRVLWRCWQDRVPYDVSRHRAAIVAA